jgi:hypothetical protein
MNGKSSLGAAAGRSRKRADVVRAVTLGLLVIVLIQYAVGMVVNLFVKVPPGHPGAKPSNYFAGSASSVAWAVAHGSAALALHAALGIALVVAAITGAVLTGSLGRLRLTVAGYLGAACVVGAGFNGASFLDFGHDISSLIMALLAAAAIACYAVILYELSRVSM